VATEKERGTAALILTKPAGRGAFLIAKLVAIATTLGLATVIAAAGGWFYTLVLFQPLDAGGFAAATVLTWLSLVAFAAITLLGSTLTRSAVAAAGIGLVAFVVIGIVSVVPGVGPYLPTGLGAPARALALGLPGTDALGPTVAAVVLIVALVAVSWLAFRDQEL
jgi:ABC-2 type transport system permease protein